jgi:lipopolysaccharide/colanic/teichoic acid biosynthesis glycosyltransferase
MSRGKRIFDVAGALGGVIFFAPVMLATAVAILVEDGRPLLFRQVRLGRGRRRFEILKFRTMRDGRITRIGAILRATGLDELPQFVNILRGELSAVGPRPITAEDAERFGYTGVSATPRWDAAPGLTGLAQLAARTRREALVLDRYYVRRSSVRLDSRLVAMSFVVNLLGKRRARRVLFANGRLRQSSGGFTAVLLRTIKTSSSTGSA